ncbi:hypothetical protein P170DRAFT_209009 [Aspergillus steynii IBT 23096]|uniref:Uncharacterized protein n=1 Tax=Aspergillus steynii IBT 23096 TaxID=1392250 RepID=A0A2I2G5V4_9EURO|nr:uncharacterized protein P170DRAFT_209009 [Aspergillus steynii IBT 23096]PLB48249.1 hypothetical protein P170DRAFT_209009 [Aspergillus steynii IBT 23096]
MEMLRTLVPFFVCLPSDCNPSTGLTPFRGSLFSHLSFLVIFGMFTFFLWNFVSSSPRPTRLPLSRLTYRNKENPPNDDSCPTGYDLSSGTEFPALSIDLQYQSQEMLPCPITHYRETASFRRMENNTRHIVPYHSSLVDGCPLASLLKKLLRKHRESTDTGLY